MTPDKPSAPAADVVSVRDAVAAAQSRLTGLLARFWIAGEVAEEKRSAAGHRYFSLRDGAAQLRCVAFAGESAAALDFKAGDKLEVRGRFDVYPRSGDLQIVVMQARRAGLGALYEAYLALQAKLRAEGLFAAERKKPLPAFVKSIALLTSNKGAAVHDVLSTLKRRTPWIRILFGNVLVQGPEAPGSVMRGLAAADAAGVDVILIVRGGGSFEDLNAFNDEALARAVAASRTPVVVAVGHESDVTLAELVADLRASTPTAAAEALGPESRHWATRLAKSSALVTFKAEQTLAWRRQSLDRAAEPLGDARAWLSAYARRLETAASHLITPEEALEHARARLSRALSALHPETGLAACRRRFKAQAGRCESLLSTRLSSDRAALSGLASALEAFNPDVPLKVGYVRAQSATGPVMRAHALRKGEELTLAFADGSALAKVLRIDLHDD